jgi:hypothetical protein
MAKRRIVTHLTVEQYMAAKAREESAATSPFRYNTETKTVKIDLVLLRERVATAAKSAKVVKEHNKAITVNDLN